MSTTLLDDTRLDAELGAPREISGHSDAVVVVSKRSSRWHRGVWISVLLAVVVVVGSLRALGSISSEVGLGPVSGEGSASAPDVSVIAEGPTESGGVPDEMVRSEQAQVDGLSVAATGGAGVPTTTPVSALDGRKVIRTGSIDMRAKDPGSVLNRATVIVEGAGGYLAQQSASYDNGADVSVVFRVPAVQFDATLRKLAALGKVVSTQVGSTEVTAQVVDLEARLKSKRLAADRVRAMMATATKAADLIAIESELANREAEIEAMQGQLNSVADQVSLSTLSFHVSTTAKAIVDEPDGRVGFAAGWNDGIDALTRGLTSAANLLGASLPFLLVLALPLAVAVVITRRRGSSRLQ